MHTSLAEMLERLSIDHPEDMPHGDMPGDQIRIAKPHIEKALALYHELEKKVQELESQRKSGRVVMSIYGGSGVGKSEIASVLTLLFSRDDVGCYILSGDNYPKRIPRDNDSERLRLFRDKGLRGMIAAGSCSQENMDLLRQLWERDEDAGPSRCDDYPFLKAYQDAGRRALEEYLGTEMEIDYAQINKILRAFHNGKESVYMKRMGRTMEALWYDNVDLRNVKLLIVEWTHGNNRLLQGVDLPVFLHSTPQETLAHRQARMRDDKIDSPFTAMVMEVEQQLLHSQAENAEIIMTKQGDMISFAAYSAMMLGEVEHFG